jgi:ABC-2 type transport system permease protein
LKALQIAWKDTRTRMRDWKALAGLLGAPLIISALLGLAFGNLDFGGTDPALTGIQLIIVNEDAGQLGQTYADVLATDQLSELFEVQEMSDLVAAREEIESGNARGVIHIPNDFSETLFPSEDNPTGGRNTVQLYLDPSANISPFIIQSVVDQITASSNTILLAAGVSVDQILNYSSTLGPALAGLEPAITAELNQENLISDIQRLSITKTEVGQPSEEIDVYAYFVPGMAVFFLMFSMFDGSRSILLEESRGTLPRLMTSPTPLSQIILGKMLGTFLTGLLQFSVLVIASTIIFGVSWGSSIPALIIIVVLTVFAASGLGAALTVFAQTETQASVIATTVALVFGALGGSFFPIQNLTGIVDIISRFTLNRWAMQGLTKLSLESAALGDVLTEASILGTIGIITFSLALLGFQRRFVK